MLLTQDDREDWTLASFLFTLKKKERGLTWQAWSIKEKDTFVLKELCRKSLMGKMDPLSRLGSQLDWQDLLCGFSRSAMFKLETNARTRKLSIGFVCTMLSQRVWWAKSQSSFLNNYLIAQWTSVLFSSYSIPDHTTPKWGTVPILYMTLRCRVQRDAASVRYKNSAKITVRRCEQKPHPVWFTCPRSIYPVLCVSIV